MARRAFFTPGGLSSREERLQGAGQARDVAGGRSRSHQPHAPDLPGEGPEPGADLDAVLLEEALADAGFVDSGRDRDRVERPETLRRRRQQLQPQAAERVRESQMV